METRRENSRSESQEEPNNSLRDMQLGNTRIRALEPSDFDQRRLIARFSKLSCSLPTG